MPELPEVHTITTDLKKYAENGHIKDVITRNGYQIHSNVEDMHTITQESTIIGVERIAKNIVMKLSSGYAITIHLAMTGRLLLRTAGHPSDSWERVVFKVTKNGKNFELRFCDMRMFGKVKVMNIEELDTFSSGYGPEPLNEAITPSIFEAMLKSKRTNIKNVLLDQKIVAGLGNVYANDALWIAKVHPETNTADLNTKMAEALLEASREMLKEGIRNRGISMSDYVDLFGKKGKQQDFFRIYQKELCPECNTKVEFIKLNGRGTYFCPNCQSKDPKKIKLL